MTERAVQNGILTALSAAGGLWYRQNSALAWVGVTVRGPRAVALGPNDVVVRDARPLRASIPGASDLIGCAGGRFVAVEVKSATGRVSEPQRVYRAAVERAGGVYVIAREPGDALAALAALA